MKKIIYFAIIAILGSFAVTSCTEENVKPAPSIGNEGGHATSDPLKG